MSDDPKVAHIDRRGILSHTAASPTLAAAGVRTGGADAGVTATSKASHGAAVNSLALQTDPAYREAIIQYCDVIVPEGALKFDAKKRALLALCRSLKSKGVPLHGISIQGHIDPNYTIDRPALERLLVEIRSMDMEITVTELDAIDQFLPADMAAGDDTAAKLVSSFLEIVCAAAQPGAILTWGSDNDYKARA